MSNTGSNIGIIERNLAPHWSRFDHLVSACDMTPKRWLETVLMTIEENPRVMDMPVENHVRFANTSATLSLEPGSATGQMFAIPFGGRRPYVQPVIGYKGYNTTAGRAGISIMGDVLREGDVWNQEIAAGEAFRFRQAFGGRQTAPIIGAWAQGRLPSGAFTTVLIMDASELEAVRAKSPGARKSDSPWNDRQGPGFAAMCAKTAKRQLQRHLPMLTTRGLDISQHMLAGGMDTLHEDVGKRTFINMDSRVEAHGRAIDDDSIPRHENGAAVWRIVRRDQAPEEFANRERWIARFREGFQKCTAVSQIDATLNAMKPVFDELAEIEPEAVAELAVMAETRKAELGGE